MLRCAKCYRRITGATPCPSDGSPPLPVLATGAVADAAPPRLDGFILGEALGEGGFAVVWEAARAQDQRPVALKVGRADAPMLVERFRREACAMASIGPPHVPELFQHGRLDDGRPYIAMDRLSGATLAARLAALPGPPSLDWVERAAKAVLSALEAAHARSVIHRDLKPENLFFPEGAARAVLLDFGLTRPAAREAPELTRSGVAVGTPEYMAPEQVRGARGVDARADVYAFGVILYELFTLRPPFVGDPSAIEHGHAALRPPRPSSFAPVPGPVEELILRCLSKEPDRRPADAAALAPAFAAAFARAATSAKDAEGASEEEAPARAALPVGAPALIAEGQQLVVIALVETSGAAAEVLGAVQSRGGFVPRQRGKRYVAVFSGLTADDPVRAALTAARELLRKRGARAALHLASVKLRRKERGAPSVYGALVDRPETWLPEEPWQGLALTAELSLALSEDERAALQMEGTTHLSSRALASGELSADRAADAPLLGRDAVLEALAESAEVALSRGRPALLTVLGEHGLGKSRVTREAMALARRAQPGALVLSLRAAQPASGDAARLSTELLSRVLDAPAVAPEDTRGVMRALAEGLLRRALTGPVAVVVDDAQWADDAALDALEYATLHGEGCPLWVVVAAHPRFSQARKGWGARTQHHRLVTLSPLEEAAGMQLAAELLRPAEYPPAAAVEQLARWSGGNPSSLSEAVRALKRAGVVRRRPNSQSFYLATAELAVLPPSPVWQWLATKQLAALRAEIAACVRLCAVLGAAFSRRELEHLQDALERSGSAGTPIDTGVGLRELADEGVLLRREGERYAFQSALFQEAVYDLLDPAQRAAVHRCALAYWRAQASAATTAEALEALARHAAACAEQEDAAEAHLRLGDLAALRHSHVEADQRYTASLAIAPGEGTRRRAITLGKRGKARVYIGRAHEALADIGEARALALALGDRRILADLLLEEATALDWNRDFDLSAQRVDEARPIVEELGVPALEARLLIADGRTAWRQEKQATSIDLLERGLLAARALGDHEGRVIALLMLSWQLSCAGRLPEAEARFEEVIALAAEADDRMHLCAAYVNRNQLWVARKEPARAMEDLRRAIALAREIGNPMAERLASYNVAELLHWSGQEAEALALARRGLMLEERFMDRALAWGPLLIARILVSLGEYAEARRLVARVAEARPPDLFEGSDMAQALNASFRMLNLVLAEVEPLVPSAAEVPGGWDEAVALAERGVQSGAIIGADDLLEILYWRAKLALRGGRAAEAAAALQQARARIDGASAWRSRFDALLVTGAASDP